MSWYQKFEKHSEMWHLFTDFWRVVQNYWNMEDTDQYWDSMFGACTDFVNRHPIVFAKLLIGAFIEEQERKHKKLPEDIEAYAKQEEMGNAKR